MDPGRHLGLLIGVTTFSTPRFSAKPLPQAAYDAEDLKNVLVEFLGWDSDDIRVLVGPITRDQVRQAFVDVSKKLGGEKDALFLVYVSTHGDILLDGRDEPEPFLLCEDTNPEDFYAAMNTGMPREFIGTMLRGISARNVILISDACHAMMPTDPESFTPSSFYKNFDVHVIGASTSEALIAKGARNSLFTSSLLQVIRASRGEITSQVLFSNAAKLLPKTAPKPFNNAKGGVINLGQRRSRITLETFLENCRKQLDAIGGRRYSNSQYVTRTFAESHFEEFRSSPSGCFTVVGAAGSGKSTLGLHLATRSLADGYPVIWLDGKALDVRKSAQETVRDEVRGLGASLEDLDTLLMRKPLIVFLDAINEAIGTDHQVKSVSKGLSEMAGLGAIRLFASCRELAWHELGTPFEGSVYLTDLEGKVSAISVALSGFDETEWEHALRVYPIPDALREAPIAREPLFLSMLAQLNKAGAMSEQASLLTVFSDYLDFKVMRIAVRLDQLPRKIEESIDRVIGAMAEESLPADQFYSLVPAAIAYSLLDEGLFRQTDDLISVEAELIHEYLLSGLLPIDLFDSPSSAKVSDRLWWGAASFRLLQIQDSGRVLKILHALTDPDQLLAVVKKLPSHPDYAELQQEFYPVLLRRIHAWFLDIHYFDWEAKRWKDIDFPKFRDRLKTYLSVTESAPPQLLAFVFDQQPEMAFSHLLQRWLGDSSGLGAGDSARISDVATIFLRQYATQCPAVCFRAMDAWLLERPDLGEVRLSDLRQILAAATQHAAETATAQALRWLRAGQVPIASLFIGHLSDEREEEVVDAICAVVRDQAGNPVSRADLLAAAGRLGSARVLKLAEESLDDPWMTRAAIRSLAEISRRLPEQADAAIARYLPKEVAKSHFSSLVAYGGLRLDDNPRLSIGIFERILAATNEEYNVEISVAFMRVACFGTEVTRFLDSRLSFENQAQALEYYGRTARQYRRIGPQDLPWIHRWIQADNSGYGLLRILSESNISLDDQMDVYERAAQKGVDFIGRSINSYASQKLEGLDVLKPYSESIIRHPNFVKLPALTQEWFTAVAKGRPPVHTYRGLVTG